MPVLVEPQLFPVAGDEQQCVVGAGPEDEHRQDSGRLAVDGDADLGQPVADATGGELGHADREQREEPEDRAPVDDQQQQEDDARGRQQQRAVDRLEDGDRVGGEAGTAGDRRLDAGLGGALDLVAGAVDRLGDRVRFPVGTDLRGQ